MDVESGVDDKQCCIAPVAHHVQIVQVFLATGIGTQILILVALEGV